MSANELLKYKELLDAGVLTQEEFDQAKEEILKGENYGEGFDMEVAPEAPKNPEKKRRIPWRRIGVITLAILVVFCAWLGIRKIVQNVEKNKDIKAVDKYIAPIMAFYELNNYKILDTGVFTEIRCEEFEDLSDQRKRMVLRDLEDIGDIEGPAGNTIECDDVRIYPDKGPAYYEYFSENDYFVIKLTLEYLGLSTSNVRVPGLYFAGDCILWD